MVKRSWAVALGNPGRGRAVQSPPTAPGQAAAIRVGRENRGDPAATVGNHGPLMVEHEARAARQAVGRNALAVVDTGDRSQGVSAGSGVVCRRCAVSGLWLRREVIRQNQSSRR